MGQSVKVSNVWLSANPYIKSNDTWKLADYVWSKSNSKWYTSFIKGGLVDKSWDSVDQTGQLGTGANSQIYSVAIQSDGKILVGGQFSTWNGTTVGRVVRLNSDGTLDTAFMANIGTGSNGTIFSIVVQSDGKILLGGGSTTWNGTTVGRIVRLNSDGTRETSFSTNIGTGANISVRSVAVQSDGKILVGGGFSTWNDTAVGYIVRLNSDGTRETSFSTNIGTGFNSEILSIAVQSDGKILVAGGLSGGFGTWNGTTVGGIVRLNSDGTRETSFTTNNGTGSNGTIYSIAVQSDGKILLGGVNFTAWNGTTVGRIVRLDSDGTRDTTFTTNNGTGANSTINSIAVQSDGKILVGGNFGTWNGTTVGRIVRLNSDGTRETAFNTNTGTGGSGINSIAVQSDGKILVAGEFFTWNGTTVGRIVRLNSDGTRETSFTTNNGTGATHTGFFTIVRSVAVQSDGKILVAGEFDGWNGTTVGYIVRLNSDGTRDTSFSTNIGTGATLSFTSPIVYSIAVQSDGKILVGGYFDGWNGTTVGYIVRLNSDGTREIAFTTNVETGANSIVRSITIQSDKKILLGGEFTTFKTASEFRRHLVRIGGENAS